jgi:hypothetical protein
MRRRSAVEESVMGCMGDGAMRCHRLQASLWLQEEFFEEIG